MTAKKQSTKPKSRKQHKNRRYGTVRKSVLIERSADYVKSVQARALNRFTLEQRPMGLPLTMNEPRRFSFEWK